MATYAQPYPKQPYGQRSTYPPIQPPPSWGRPPYAGAAPPIPAGVAVNPQQWQAGFWQVNPAYKQPANAPPQQQQQHAPWIPSHHWTQPQRHPQQQQQQQAQASVSQSSQSSQQPSYNPYKRVPKPPSKEYLETELSDNPLGLENMVPVSVEQYYRQGHQTPWIWKPRDLDDDSSIPNDSGPSLPRRHTDGDLTNNREPESFTSKRELQPTFSSKIVRTPEHYRHDSGSISNSTSTPSPKRAASYGSVDSHLSARMSGLSTNSSSPSSPTPLSRQSTMPSSSSSTSTSFTSLWSASPTKPDFSSSAPMLAEHLSEEPDSMLSPLLFAKTPLPPGPSALRTVTVRNHPNPLLATQSLDTIPEAPSYHATPAGSANNTRGPPEPYQQQQQQQGGGGGGGNYYSTTSLQHANTMPNPPKSQYVYPTNPPQMRLPPKNPEQDHDREREWERDRDNRERERDRDRDREREQDRERERERERGLGTRHTTYVDPHFTSTSTSTSSSSTNTPSPRSRVPSRSSSAHASPVRHAAAAAASTVTPPTYPTSPPPREYPHAQQQQQRKDSNPNPYPYMHANAHAHAAYPSPSTTITSPASQAVFSPTPSSTSTSTTATSMTSTSTTRPPSNPLPAPPSLPTSRAPALILPTPRTPPSSFHTRTRRGFWNRRGDFLTADGYIVYSPAHLAYPAELASYPEESVGYQDHNKLFAAHCARPELPASLPRWGMPPECPYEKFVVYEYT